MLTHIQKHKHADFKQNTTINIQKIKDPISAASTSPCLIF